MANSRIILVTGATGNLGGALLKVLIAKGAGVKAGTTKPHQARFPQDIQVTKVDYNQPETVASALKGIDGLFLVAPPLDPDAAAKLTPIIDQAKAAKVGHIVFNSALGVDQNDAAPLRVIEKHLIGSGVNYTILRPNFFMENFSSGFIAPMIAQGGIYLAAGNARTSFISTEDIAAVAAAAFEEEKFGAEFNLTGPDALDHGQVARILSEVSGKAIQYHALTEAQMLQGARDQGMPEGAVQYMAVLYQAVRNNWMEAVTADVQKVLGRAPMSFGAFAQKNAAVWK